MYGSVSNTAQVGGGADLASKAQILAYYELVLADLKVSLINFNFYQHYQHLQVMLISNFKITVKICILGNLPPAGHRQADVAASLRVQGQRQGGLAHTSRQGDPGCHHAFYQLRIC